jgi:quercetin dioxygenase-like cupin family protein
METLKSLLISHMSGTIKIFLAFVLLIGAGMSGAAEPGGAVDKKGARENSGGITLTSVTSQALPHDSGTTLTAVIVDLAPGAQTGSHRHAGTVFVHVLEGTVRSQLNSGEIIEYRAGESWSEAPGTVHSFMENPSQAVPARLLATIIAPTGAQLTTHDK